jgi:hypothetical protein
MTAPVVKLCLYTNECDKRKKLASCLPTSCSAHCAKLCDSLGGVPAGLTKKAILCGLPGCIEDALAHWRD